MHFFTNLQSSKTIQWIDSSVDGWLKCLPFIYQLINTDSFICQLINMTSTSIGVLGSHEVVSALVQKFYMAQWAVFSHTYHKMYLVLW